MGIVQLIKPFVPAFILERFRNGQIIWTPPFVNKADVKTDIQRKYGFNGDLLDIFAGNQGNVVHKWHHYIPLYERYFSPYRGKPLKFLEIGVSKGGSLQMWRSYFGESATIFGIDIDPDCAKYNGQAGQVRIGSQTDIDFLEAVVSEMGGVDIVLDDGGHHMDQIMTTLKALFPRLNNGGIYLIEDLHTAYWLDHGGGYRSKDNFFRFLSYLSDDMHRWYSRKKPRHFDISRNCSGIHIHDSIAVLDKNEVYHPVHSEVGSLGTRPPFQTKTA